MLMFTREGSSCNNNRHLTGDMQQAKSLLATWRQYTVFPGRKQISIISSIGWKMMTFIKNTMFIET